MPHNIDDVTAQILFHVEAEDASVDNSQAPGVNGRAEQMRVLLDPYKGNSNAAERVEFLGMLRNENSQAGLQQLMDDFRDNDEGQRLRVFMKRWVGENLTSLEEP